MFDIVVNILKYVCLMEVFKCKLLHISDTSGVTDLKYMIMNGLQEIVVHFFLFIRLV